MGLIICKGDFICFIDPDDYCESNYIKRLLDGAKEYGLSLCGYNRVTEESIKYFDRKDDFVITKEEFLKKIFIEDSYGAGFIWNKLFSKHLLEEIFFDESISFGEDIDYLLKLLDKINDVYICNEGLYNYYQNDDGLSKKRSENKYKKECEICEDYIKYVKINNLNNVLSYACLRYLRVFSQMIIECNDIYIYKLNIRKSRKMFLKILPIKDIESEKKVKIFLKLFFPRIIRFILYFSL